MRFPVLKNTNPHFALKFVERNNPPFSLLFLMIHPKHISKLCNYNSMELEIITDYITNTIIIQSSQYFLFKNYFSFSLWVSLKVLNFAGTLLGNFRKTAGFSFTILTVRVKLPLNKKLVYWKLKWWLYKFCDFIIAKPLV